MQYLASELKPATVRPALMQMLERQPLHMPCLRSAAACDWTPPQVCVFAEQAKAFLDLPDQLTAGLNLINQQDLCYFQPHHQAELFRLKGVFLQASCCSMPCVCVVPSSAMHIQGTPANSHSLREACGVSHQHGGWLLGAPAMYPDMRTRWLAWQRPNAGRHMHVSRCRAQRVAALMSL